MSSLLNWKINAKTRLATIMPISMNMGAIKAKSVCGLATTNRKTPAIAPVKLASNWIRMLSLMF